MNICVKLENPTPTRHPGVSAVPSAATKLPRESGRYTVPVLVSVIVSAAASYVSADLYR